ncbi:MAG TPA: hypothetical protein VFI96_01120 [Longimicrobiaceae bacterium]|nr:hypothetical protein [Longimicrobiaceae bacterium]
MRVRGRGRVEVAGYGVADAEHLVEKELGTLWPEARIAVLDVARTDPESRIVEEFAVSFTVEGVLRVEGETEEDAARAAFRQARQKLAGSRYERVEWGRVASSN